MRNFNRYDEHAYILNQVHNFLNNRRNIDVIQDKFLEKMYMDDYYLYKADGIFSGYENCYNRRTARIKLDINLFVRAIEGTTNDYFDRHIYWPLIKFGAHENLSDLQDKVICFTEDSMQIHYHENIPSLANMNEPEKNVIIAFDYLLYDKDEPAIAHVTNVLKFKENEL